MILILVRHGNTFGPSDNVVWVGKGEDLPLVEAGQDQARALGQRLIKYKQRVKQITSSPLLRAKQTAQIIADALSLPDEQLTISEYLQEIDYGSCGGKTTEELQALGFSEALAAWDREGAYPKSMPWKTTEEELMQVSALFLEEAAEFSEDQSAISIAVTSNGTLRFLLRQIPEAFELYRERKALKVKTGNLSILYKKNEAWSVRAWNISPEELSNDLLTA